MPGYRSWLAAAGLVVLAVAPRLAHTQTPGASWAPNYTPLGVYCSKSFPNPNTATAGHDGGCGCENTQFRINGTLYMMESTGHSCDLVFPGYNSTTQGDCSYFRIRDWQTGLVIANVSEAIGHSFFAAVVDHSAAPPRVWVFGSAHARGNKVHPNKCDVSPYRGCYVGAWSSTDLVHWTKTAKALTLPDGYAFFNNDVALVRTRGAPGLPAHQALMILELRSDPDVPRSVSPFAINTGTDGDLSRGWKMVLDTNFSLGLNVPKPAGFESTGDAPTLRYDDEQQYYYSAGGGWITDGWARSQTLRSGSWELSPKAPAAIPAGVAHVQGLPPPDSKFYTDAYSALWTPERKAGVQPWLDNATAWNWGVTDPDVCCGDGRGPSFMIHTLSRQGAPSNFSGASFGFSAVGTYPGSLNEWLRSFFP